MCHHCVVESVKKRMLSRRDMFRTTMGGAAALAAGGVAGGVLGGAAPALAQGASRVHDMTHELYPEFPTYFGAQQLFMDQKFNFKDNGFNLFEMRINEHTGTHIDAPLHFSADGQDVSEIPVEKLVAPLAVVDIREKAAGDVNAQVTPEDIDAWTAANGPLPAGCCVAMNSGWAAKVDGPAFRNADADGKMHFPGFHVDAVKKLIEESSAVGIAVDTLSLDYGQSADFATHYAWLPSGRWGLECIAGLDHVPAKGATLIVGAPKVRGGTGGPSRVLAMV